MGKKHQKILIQHQITQKKHCWKKNCSLQFKTVAPLYIFCKEGIFKTRFSYFVLYFYNIHIKTTDEIIRRPLIEIKFKPNSTKNKWTHSSTHSLVTLQSFKSSRKPHENDQAYIFNPPTKTKHDPRTHPHARTQEKLLFSLWAMQRKQMNKRGV